MNPSPGSQPHRPMVPDEPTPARRHRAASGGFPLPRLESDGEVIEWMLRHLSDDELDEFLSELSDQRTKLSDQRTRSAESFAEWWAGWLVSMRLNCDQEFNRQAKETARRVELGELGEPVGVDDIRRLILG